MVLMTSFNSLNLSFSKTLKKTLVQIIKSCSVPLSPVETGITPDSGEIKGIKSIIFDVYGTMLVSASGDIGVAQKDSNSCMFNKAAEQSGIVIIPDTPCEYFKNLFLSIIKESHLRLTKKGIDFPEVDILSVWQTFFATLHKENIIRTQPEKEVLIKFSLYYELLTNPVWPMPELVQTLDKLRSKGIVTGIVSNAQFYTPLIFEVLTGREIGKNGFKEDLIFYSYKSARAKPSLFMFEKLKEQLYNNYGILGKETLYVGNDMLNDIKTASLSGFRTVLFAGDRRSLRLRKDICQDIVPDTVITCLDQLNKRIL